MFPDRRAAAVAAFALVSLGVATPACAQALTDWGLPGSRRAAPYAATIQMLPPNASEGFVASGGNGAGSPGANVLVENRGTVELSFVVAGSTGVCGRYKVQPNDIVPALRCGDRIAWSDSRETRQKEIRPGGIYQFYWNVDHWDLADVTADRLN